MKTELQKAINHRLSGLHMDGADIRRALEQAKKREEPMKKKKKLTLGLAIAIAVAAISTLALAAELTGNVFSDLYKRYFGIQLTEEAQTLTATAQPIHTFDFQTATFTIEQAISDGYHTYISASVAPKEEANVLLAADEATELDDPLVIDTELEWTQTYRQAMEERGAALMAATMDFTYDGQQPDVGSGLTSLNKDGQLRMVFVSHCPSTEKQMAIDLEAVMFERMEDGIGELERQRHTFTVDVMPTEEKTFTVGETIPGSKIIVDSIKLVKSPLTMYYETIYRFADDAAAAEWKNSYYPAITYFDGNGRRIEHGTVGGGTDLVDGRIVSRASLDLKEFPQELGLMVEGMEPNTYHGYLTVREEEPMK